MTLELAIRCTEIMLALAVVQQSAEHLGDRRDRLFFVLRIGICVWLLSGMATGFALLALWVTSLVHLHRFGGAYSGGSDKMTILITTCLTLAHWLPAPLGPEMAMAYLAVQLVLSYFVSGYVKVVKPAWRSGQALVDVFSYSAYPVSVGVRGWADYPRLLRVMSWGVMGFEVLFPLALLHPSALLTALFVGASFHLANAVLFGLNRFFWIWLCAYPSVIWFQDRFVG